MYGKFLLLMHAISWMIVHSCWCMWDLNCCYKKFLLSKILGRYRFCYCLCHTNYVIWWNYSNSLLSFSSINRVELLHQFMHVFQLLHPCNWMLSCPKWNAEFLFLILQHIFFSYSSLNKCVLFLIFMFALRQ